MYAEQEAETRVRNFKAQYEAKYREVNEQKEIWAIYQNRVKAVYANVAAKTATASLKDGNICVRQSPNHYVCGYSLRPEEDSD